VRIETIESGFFKTNTYLVIDELTNRAMLIDQRAVGGKSPRSSVRPAPK
jgi:hypothetical protein